MIVLDLRKRERRKRGFSCSFKITYVAVDKKAQIVGQNFYCHVTIEN